MQLFQITERWITATEQNDSQGILNRILFSSLEHGSLQPSPPEEEAMCVFVSSLFLPSSPLFPAALQHAGKHMEDSIVASYTALLLGCLCQGSQVSILDTHKIQLQVIFTLTSLLTHLSVCCRQMWLLWERIYLKGISPSWRKCWRSFWVSWTLRWVWSGKLLWCWKKAELYALIEWYARVII